MFSLVRSMRQVTRLAPVCRRWACTEPYQLDFDEFLGLQEALGKAAGGTTVNLDEVLQDPEKPSPCHPMSVTFTLEGGKKRRASVTHSKHQGSGAGAFSVKLED
eukprot:Hpha_TRINITY_DN20347_c0_g1::TRINITY_DN20347_c0_g1_i1::g.138221::m.138221